jgi:hypothetical protein
MSPQIDASHLGVEEVEMEVMTATIHATAYIANTKDARAIIACG